MYETKKKYEEYKPKDEIKYHVPEWIRIFQDYFKKNYNKNYLAKSTKEKNKKKSIEDLS